MNTKIIPFNLETAKKIQAGEIEGRIVTKDNCSVNILCFNSHMMKHKLECPIVAEIKEEDGYYLDYYPNDGWHQASGDKKHLFIELPEEEPKQDSFNKKLHDTAEVLATPKHEFEPFDKVLVRSGDNTEWCTAIYSHYSPTDTFHYIASGCHWKYCIPYEGNEHLVGATDKPKEE